MRRIMRPKRNRGESHKKNVLRKYIIKFIVYDSLQSEPKPIICKKGSYDPRTGGAWPGMTQKENFMLKKLFKIKFPRYYSCIDGDIKEPSKELNEFFNIHKNNKYAKIIPNNNQGCYYVNINPYTLVIDGLINFDKNLYYHDTDYNSPFKWDYCGMNRYIPQEASNKIKPTKKDAAKLRHHIYYNEINYNNFNNKYINNIYMTYLPLKYAINKYYFKNLENFLNNYFCN